MKKLQNKKGFTLTEMIVVLAIIGILIALLAPNVARLIRNAQMTADSAKAKNVMTAGLAYGTEAITAGQAIIGTPITSGTEKFHIVALTAGNAGQDAFLTKYYTTKADAITAQGAFMDNSGNSMLPANTVKGTDQVFFYISTDGVVMGTVYCNGTTVKAVSGICPSTAIPVTTEFNTTTLKGKTFTVADGKIN